MCFCVTLGEFYFSIKLGMQFFKKIVNLKFELDDFGLAKKILLLRSWK